MPITKATASSIAPAAKGDLVVGSATNDAGVLAVGTNNYVLTADSAETLGVKWAAASTGAMTKITSQTVSAVASVTFDGCFTSSYGFYLVTFEGFYCSDPNDDLQLQLRYSSTTETTGYYGSSTETLATTGGVAGYGYRATAQATLTRQAGGSASANGTYFYTTNVGVSGRPTWFGQSIQNAAGGEAAVTFAGTYDGTARTFDGFLIKSSGGNNLTGTIRVYGMAV